MEKVILSQFTEPEIRKIFREELQGLLTSSGFSNSPTSEMTVFNFKEGCQYLCISESHGYKLTSQQLIPHSKQGKRIYFEKADLDQWRLSNKVKTQTEIAEETTNYLKEKAK